MPESTAQRALAAVRDPSRAPDFDRFSRIAASALDVPIAQLNVIVGDRHVPVGVVGPGPLAAPREIHADASLSACVVQTGRSLTLDDVRAHPNAYRAGSAMSSGIAAFVGVPIVLGDGAVVGCLCVADIAPREWTASEAALLADIASLVSSRLDLVLDTGSEARRRSEEHFRAMVDHAAVGIAIVDIDGRWRQVNPRLCEIVGYSADELLARTFQDLTHPDDLDANVALYERLLTANETFHTHRKRYVRRDGQTVWIDVMLSLVHKPDGTPDHVVAIIEDVTDWKRAREELADSRMEVLERLVAAAEYRDDDTGKHTMRVGVLSARIATALGLPHETAELLRRAAPLHDVGKIGLPDRILLKPGKLTPAEFEEMKAHTTMGARILAGGRSPLIRMAERIARSHHERWDGTGYPDGLAGSAIPIEARIVAVADVLDALSHARPYRAAWPMTKVLELLRAGRGGQFDAAVVDALLSIAFRHEEAPAQTAVQPPGQRAA